MTAVNAAPKKMPPPAIRAEAAAWLAHLRGPERTAEVEEGFRLWLAASPENKIAFELATDVWERSVRLQRRPQEQAESLMRPAFRLGFAPMTAVAAAVAAIAVMATVWYLRDDAVMTAVGEQRTITLDDGSRIFFNTDTRAVVQYTDGQRLIRLDRGEALFEVAPRAGRPFIVAAGATKVEALGTSFVVRRDTNQLAVTLVDGKVAITSSFPPLRAAGEGQEGGIKYLTPGERLTLAANRTSSIDTPPIDKLIAWQRGQVAFDNTPLADAVKEMNRYSTVKLTIERPDAATMRIGGVFRAGDAASFAEAMAATYSLQPIDKPNEIVLTGSPRAPER